MATYVTFSGWPMSFFCGFPGGTAPWAQSAKSSIIPLASVVTASIQGSNATQFGTLSLRAWTPVTVFTPPPSSGELPVGAGSLLVGGVHKSTGYVISARSGGSTPISINKGGYLEIWVSPNPVVLGSDGRQIVFPPWGPGRLPNNRFVASVVVNGAYVSGTNWTPNPIQIDLVLNAVQIAQTSLFWSPPGLVPKASTVAFIAGQGSMTIAWIGSASLWPDDPADYPIQHSLVVPGFGPEPFLGELVTGQLWIDPPDPSVIWLAKQIPPHLGATDPDDGAPPTQFAINASGNVSAAPTAQATSGPTPLLFPPLAQSFFNGSDVPGPPPLTGNYTIAALTPIVTG
jgi:hypothetical protein